MLSVIRKRQPDADDRIGRGTRPKAATTMLGEFSAAHLRRMLDGVPIAIMTCDLDEFRINYVNRATVENLRKIEKLLPCRADDIVGQCIDIFHKNPAHQRALLGDPKNLPHKANIKLGEETLALDVSARSTSSTRTATISARCCVGASSASRRGRSPASARSTMSSA